METSFHAPLLPASFIASGALVCKHGLPGDARPSTLRSITKPTKKGRERVRIAGQRENMVLDDPAEVFMLLFH